MLWLKSESMIRPSTMIEMHALAAEEILDQVVLASDPESIDRPRVEIASCKGRWSIRRILVGSGMKQSDDLAEKTR